MKSSLLLLTRYPYPPVGGDKVKSHNLIKILARNFNLKVIIITDEAYDEQAEKFLKENVNSYSVFRFASNKFKINILKGLFKKTPIQVSYYYFPKVHKKIKQDIENSDIVIANLIRTTRYLEKTEKKKYLDIVDAIGLHYIEATKKTTSLFWKILYAIEGKRVLKYEIKCVSNFNCTFFVNKQEAETYSQYGNTTWIPNGVDSKLLSYNSSPDINSRKVVFFGKMNYQPNVEAISWYIDHVHKHLPDDYEFIILGTSPSKKVLKKAKAYNNIKVTGYVENPYEILCSCSLAVAPMQIGGGIQNKVLESMALGQINVLTSKVANPITGATSGVHFLVEDDPLKMANLIRDILNDRDSYVSIGKNAREIIRNNYTWKQYEDKLLRILT
ncbi:MAG: glycosyltransferase family 4 protein [Flavobacteriaceae bacterium]|jgi:glycosyltransferase involved in cell wall biosynthesis|nr:glycosyltransferase family 4 protein [Flavobacteriaceae bacterium]